MPENQLPEIARKADEIYTTLTTLPPSNHFSILGGELGKALFYIYYAELTDKEEALDKALEIINKATLAAPHIIRMGASLSMGITGLGWFISHIEKEGLLKTGSTSLLNQFDAIILPQVLGNLKTGNYDYLHGALGGGGYFLNRKRTKKNIKILEKIVQQLALLSVTEGNYVKWNHHDNERFVVLEGEYNWGLSHGTPSILMFLINCYEAGILTAITGPLIEGTVNFMLTAKQDPLTYGSYFPYGSKEGVTAPQRSRLAWCYGDLGILIPLWKANELFEFNGLDELLSEMADFEVSRKALEPNQVYDAGFCHGASGVAHIFNNMFKRTHDKRYKEAAEYWYDMTLKMARFDDGLAGYKAYRVTPEPHFASDPSLLEGLAGIGIVLVSALSEKTLNWDNLFLLQ